VNDERGRDDILQREIDLLALAGEIAGVERGHRTDEATQAAFVLRLHAAVLERLAIGGAADAHDAGEAVRDDLFVLVLAVRPGLAEWRDRHHDEPRVVARKRGIVKPE
jgi:hypothetical protein